MSEERIDELERLIEQLCTDLNEAHDEIMELQGCNEPKAYDWPEWSSQANSIRWAERLLGKGLAKTEQWSLYKESSEGKETTNDAHSEGTDTQDQAATE